MQYTMNMPRSANSSKATAAHSCQQSVASPEQMTLCSSDAGLAVGVDTCNHRESGITLVQCATQSRQHTLIRYIADTVAYLQHKAQVEPQESVSRCNVECLEQCTLGSNLVTSIMVCSCYVQQDLHPQHITHAVSRTLLAEHPWPP